MPDGGNNFESFAGAPTGQEAASESQEQFNERYRQAQAAIKQIKKEEKKKKVQDDSLAQIIVQFLQAKNRTALFLLISRLVARNTPSDFILALIALVHSPAASAVEHKLLELPNHPSEALVKTGTTFTPGQKQRIDAWTDSIIALSKKEADKILYTTIDVTGDIAPEAVQIFALVLREYLETLREDEVRMDNMTAFAQAFFAKFVEIMKQNKEEKFLLQES